MTLWCEFSSRVNILLCRTSQYSIFQNLSVALAQDESYGVITTSIQPNRDSFELIGLNPEPQPSRAHHRKSLRWLVVKEESCACKLCPTIITSNWFTSITIPDLSSASQTRYVFLIWVFSMLFVLSWRHVIWNVYLQHFLMNRAVVCLKPSPVQTLSQQSYQTQNSHDWHVCVKYWFSFLRTIMSCCLHEYALDQ